MGYSWPSNLVRSRAAKRGAKVGQWRPKFGALEKKLPEYLITGVDAKGKFFIPENLEAYARHKASQEGLSVEDTWPREVEAAGMFKHGERGSCSSSAIYLAGCLRALGVPTRTVLCIPIIDAGDDLEWELLKKGVQHNSVRITIESALHGARQSWSSHTFNEVYVEGRWHRLNYSDLDAGVLNEGFFGLMTHVATFHDWADARMWETVGPRAIFSNKKKKLDIFGHHNPYSTIALRDSFGMHSTVQNPPMEESVMTVEALYWTDSNDLPKDILASNHDRGRFGLIAEVPARSMNALLQHLKRANNRAKLSSAGTPDVWTRFHSGCIWFKSDRGFLYLPIDEEGRKRILQGATYRVTAPHAAAGPQWMLDEVITR